VTPATGTALLILAAFVMPGFVTILVKERIYEVPSEQQAFERLLQTLYYSLLVYALPIVLAVAVGADRAWFDRLFHARVDLRLTALVAFGVAIVLPVETLAQRGSGHDFASDPDAPNSSVASVSALPVGGTACGRTQSSNAWIAQEAAG
jgi:hypothetical protein